MFPCSTILANSLPQIRSFFSVWALVVLALLYCSNLIAGSNVAEPDDYRMVDYRSPVPDTLQGATVVDVLEAKNLHENNDTIFIDVLPAQRKPEGLQETDIWLPKPHKNIPGSAWLPDVGFGAISDEMENYFKQNLERLINKDKSKNILIYCRADCWMSWNAAKRTLDYGYTRVYWFPEGTDGWSEAGFNLEISKPIVGYDLNK